MAFAGGFRDPDGSIGDPGVTEMAVDHAPAGGKLGDGRGRIRGARRIGQVEHWRQTIRQVPRGDACGGEELAPGAVSVFLLHCDD